MLQLKNIISINNLVALLLASFVLAACTTDPADPLSQRITLGTIPMALVSSRANTTDFQFRGRVTGFDTRDTLYSVQGVGSFKHFLALKDTLTSDTLRIYYTLPLSQSFKVDTTLRLVAVYKKIQSRFALILRSKNDSLVAMIGTLLPEELDTIQTKTGAQVFRVAVGTDLYASRNSDCGREGDFNMVFTTNQRFVDVAPGRNRQIISGDKTYAAVNIANTQLIRAAGGCPNFKAVFSYMIIRQ